MYTIPGGWTLVGYQGNQNAACPGGYTQTNLVENPSVPASACSCSCSITQQPSCPSGNIAVHYDFQGAPGAGMCGSAGVPSQMPYSTSCDNNNMDLYHGGGGPASYKGLDLEYSPPAGSGAICGKSATAQMQNVTDTPVLSCTPTTPPCNGNQCTPDFPSPLVVCIAKSGHQSCPGNTPFTVLHDVGTGVTFTCDAGGCGCNVSPAGPCTGTIKLFTDPMCMNTSNELDIKADGQCHASGAQSDSYAAYEYAPDPAPTATCTATGSATVQNAGLTMEQTICCTP